MTPRLMLAAVCSVVLASALSAQQAGAPKAGQTPARRIRCVLPDIESLDAEPNGPDR